ncbi:unnamed protein product [Calypogeia fissa]
MEDHSKMKDSEHADQQAVSETNSSQAVEEVESSTEASVHPTATKPICNVWVNAGSKNSVDTGRDTRLQILQTNGLTAECTRPIGVESNCQHDSKNLSALEVEAGRVFRVADVVQQSHTGKNDVTQNGEQKPRRLRHHPEAIFVLRHFKQFI